MQSLLCVLLLAVSSSLITGHGISMGGNAGIGENEEFDALTYLTRAGYLDDLEARQYHAPDNIKTALKEFQAYAGLNITGRLDKATVIKMKQPRCGVPDVIKPSLRKDPNDPYAPSEYKAIGYKWYKNDLSYKFNNYISTLTVQQQESAIAAALKRWSDVTPLKFHKKSGTVDIDISYGRGRHIQCRYPFDGPGGVLAHAFHPGYYAINGDLHLDADENWTYNKEYGHRSAHLESIAAHELGHALGLDHSTDPNALMYAFYNGAKGLNQDDIAGIQYLYGKKGGSSNNPYNPYGIGK